MVSLEQIGIENLKTYDLKGSLFQREEDFIVQEVEEDGKILSIDRDLQDELPKDKDDYLVFTLVKRGISTPEAIKLISRQLHISFKRIACNGNKDKRAITSQRLSIFKFAAEALKLNSDRLFVRDIAYSSQPCKIGKLYGNHFTVIVKDFETNENLEKIKEEISKGIPNFYGPQRFGSSSLNIAVSKSIINQDFKSAFYDLVLKERAESDLNKQKRKLLREVFSDYVLGGQIDTKTAEEALSNLPGFMFYEKEALHYLLQHKNDYAGAIRLMPKYTRLMILQAYQYYLFNKTLSRLTKENLSLNAEIPAVGFDFEFNDDQISKVLKTVLEEEGINDLERFRIKSMPEASLKTFKHPTFFFPENFSIDVKDKEAVFTFDLRKGSYATILLIKLFGVDNVYNTNKIPDETLLNR
ncbi:MAG: tRNA pseudouridine(13) synthase TruD [Candidatus Parvarchaeum sp.]